MAVSGPIEYSVLATILGDSKQASIFRIEERANDINTSAFRV